MNCKVCQKETLNASYCSSSCSAKDNNSKHPKRKLEGQCETCNTPIKTITKFCDDCKKGLSKEFQPEIQEEIQRCKQCNVISTEENSYRCKTKFCTYCKDCKKSKARKICNNAKLLAIRYKGSKCSVCGYCKNLAALQFHHLDPTKKDFAISKALVTSKSEVFYNELDKTILVCSNCHFELHNPLLDIN